MNKISEKQKKALNVIQWILIAIFSVLCVIIYMDHKKNVEQVRNMDETYMKIYESQTLASLKKENRALYDSIKNLSNVESAVEVRYETIYATDTIYAERFIQGEDSVYHYTQDDDTIETNIDIKATDLQWCNVDAKIKSKFTIVTQNDDGKMTTTIQHGDNVQIDDVTTWRKKKNWTENFFIGPSVGVGYGVFTKKPDIYVGISVGYKF